MTLSMRFLFLICCAWCMANTTGIAQSYDFGVGIDRVKKEDEVYLTSYDATLGISQRKLVTRSTDVRAFPLFNAYLGFNFPVRITNNVSVAAHPCVSGGISTHIYGSYGVFVLFKHGADATNKANKRLGIAVGPGYKVFGITHDVGSGTVLRTPALMAQLACSLDRFQKVKLKLQFVYHIIQTAEKYSASAEDKRFDVYYKTTNPYAFHLIVCGNLW